MTTNHLIRFFEITVLVMSGSSFSCVFPDPEVQSWQNNNFLRKTSSLNIRWMEIKSRVTINFPWCPVCVSHPPCRHTPLTVLSIQHLSIVSRSMQRPVYITRLKLFLSFLFCLPAIIYKYIYRYISGYLSNFLFPFLLLSECFLLDLVMIAVLYIIRNLASIANCIFFSVVTYKWSNEKLSKYTKIIVKRASWCSHIFHELFRFSPVSTF